MLLSEWPRGLSSWLFAAEVKLVRAWSTSGWVTLETLTKHLTPLFFGGDVELGAPCAC